MNEPKDHEEKPEIPKVQDVVAEDRIKWGVIAQTLILLSITGFGGVVMAIGSTGIDWMEKINNTLIEVRDEISKNNTGVKVNSTRIDNHDNQFESFDSRINDNQKAIQAMRR